MVNVQNICDSLKFNRFAKFVIGLDSGFQYVRKMRLLLHWCFSFGMNELAPTKFNGKSPKIDVSFMEFGIALQSKSTEFFFSCTEIRKEIILKLQFEH